MILTLSELQGRFQRVMRLTTMTDSDAYFLTTDVPNGLKHFVRLPMSTSMEGDFDTGNVRYKARERYSWVLRPIRYVRFTRCAKVVWGVFKRPSPNLMG